MMIVETNSISKTYKSGLLKRMTVPALTDVSLSVHAGEIFGLLGPNGAGKTTFVKILLSIVHPTSGTGSIRGEALGSLKIRARSGYLPENHRYPLFLTGYETLRFFGGMSGLSGNALKEKAHSLLELVGLREWKKVKIKRYSKGMLQRLGLAQALLNDPEILFLDEPTDGVDPVGRKEIRDLLKQLRAEGKTIFLNSHLLSEVEAISDRVAILNKGKVLKVGTVSEITSRALEYEVRLDRELSASVLSLVRPYTTSLRVETNALMVGVRGEADLNRIIDIIRAEGIQLRGFQELKSSLEDSFIELIQSKENP